MGQFSKQKKNLIERLNRRLLGESEMECHSARTCRTWAKGGPIKKDKISYKWQEKNT